MYSDDQAPNPAFVHVGATVPPWKKRQEIQSFSLRASGRSRQPVWRRFSAAGHCAMRMFNLRLSDCNAGYTPCRLFVISAIRQYGADPWRRGALALRHAMSGIT
jgi:hypothetical protein